MIQKGYNKTASPLKETRLERASSGDSLPLGDWMPIKPVSIVSGCLISKYIGDEQMNKKTSQLIIGKIEYKNPDTIGGE